VKERIKIIFATPYLNLFNDTPRRHHDDPS